MIIGSRMFGLDGNKNSKNGAFVPYADMFNHKSKCKTKWYFSKDPFSKDSY